MSKANRELEREANLILEKLKEHSPIWVKILRKYIRQLEALQRKGRR